MVKFSKELEAQLIPEWKNVYVNYRQLKKHVKRIKLARKPMSASDANYDFGRSIFYPVRDFFSRIYRKLNNGEEKPEIDQTKINGGENGEGEGEREREEVEVYEPELLQLFSEEDEIKVFFERLDEEMKKVNEFYKTTEKEFLERGDIWIKQLQILLDLKRVLTDRRRRNVSYMGSGFFSRSNSSYGRNSDYSESQSDYFDSPSGSQREDVIAALEKNGVNFVKSATLGKTKNGKPNMAKRIDIPATTPARTISTVASMLWEDLVNNPKKEGGRGGEFINRKRIQCAEKKIRGAFVELYRGLGFLKTYSSLNMKAFTKILKKFDKVSNRQASASYLKDVKSSHFISSDKVVRLMDEVESLFTQHFANNDRKKAMKFLRPQQHKDSHVLTFFVGLFTGSFATLFSVYAILAHLSGMFTSRADAGYMETVYPIFSMFALLCLHLFMYGCNLLTWKSARINYNFIFEFQPKTALKYRDAFLICTSLMTAVVGALIIHLILISQGFSPRQVDMIPGILLLFFIGLLICPLNIFYRPTRYSFIKVLRNIVCSPFYKVLMVDFFMADQLTSQIPLLRHMESASCYFLAGSFKTHSYEMCKSAKLYKELAYVISFAPYYWRAMQCARRWFDECNPEQLANLGKYVSAMVAAGARLTYDRQPTQFWLVIVLLTSLVATVYQLYWDFVKDWGLLKPKSKNPWLRDDLVLKNKSIYYVSIALNIVLRVAWVETVMRFKSGMLESRLLEFFLASLEVIRRGHWNFYRLENEHLKNVGKFTAVKIVPLPFRETDSDG
ncbi:phosphate transporter PHO1 [Olea europaea subsp. europaea]|uniref:Phosphate transporter PHO1 n=1 Tax=Olea europaea subsp. europaea TaxID=158383 RepID=A0A8S0Q7P5_OLEEU|nr:phosphate transporter PHO1 [Olea europaea subsp. europaea]CAA2962929.1 phosphate transporter PHO1 [Olea europaea subsp. europaea]